MGYPHGRAHVSPWDREAFAVCDRCGEVRNHSALTEQREYRGNDLVGIGLMVCRDTCLDKPFEGNRPITTGPDGLPIKNPRPLNRAATDDGGEDIETMVDLLIED